MARDNSPSGSVLAVNNSIRCVKLPKNTRTPIEYTITAGAYTPNATTMAITVSPTPTVENPLVLDENTPLKFGANTVTWNSNDATTSVQVITSASATVGVTPMATAPTGTATTKGLVELLGVQNMDLNRNSNLISIRSQKSGLGNEQRTTMISYEFQISGWIHQQDYTYSQIVKPVFNEAGEIYAEVDLNDGTKVSGVFGISNLSSPIQLDQVMQMQFTLYAQGLPKEEIVDDEVSGGGSAPVTYDTTINKDTTTNNGGVTIGFASSATTLSFNKQTSPTGTPTTQNVSVGGSVVGSVNFQSSYVGQPWRLFYNGQTYNGTFATTDATFA